MFWKRATPNAALSAAIGSFIISLIFKVLWPELPFMDRVAVVFVLCAAMLVSISVATPYTPKEAAEITKRDFETSSSFKLATVGVVIILAALYITWW